MNHEQVVCDAICDTNDLIQKIDSSCDTCDFFDVNNDDVHSPFLCHKTQNDDPSDIFEGN